MSIPTLVVSDPPHGEVDLEAAAKLLQLDGFATRLKAGFAAPEVMHASDHEAALRFAASLQRAGFRVQLVDGARLTDPEWPDPISVLVFDGSFLQGTTATGVVRVPYDAEVLAVQCLPPSYRHTRVPEGLERAIASGHGPTIAEAMSQLSVVDLYFRTGPSLERVTIVPERLKLETDRVLKDVGRRFKHLKVDARLKGVRPRAPFSIAAGYDGSERRRYSFGTLMLRQVLESIAPELRAIPQYEFASRLAYALSPLATKVGPSA
jgi:hypothetical protein